MLENVYAKQTKLGSYSYACSRTNHHVCMHGAARGGGTQRQGESLYTASCSINIDLACSCHHSHHSHSLAAACLHREGEVGAETSLQPAHITSDCCKPDATSPSAPTIIAPCKPALTAKVQNKATHRLQSSCTVKHATAQWCNTAGRRANLVSKALAFPLDPWPWWACS